jgi:polysaccharide chain length determinant protein (PEP-CTERM system associated)
MDAGFTMEDEELLGIGDYVDILKRRKMQAIIPGLVALLFSAILAIGLPSIYRSEATILIEQQEIPSELVRSTVTSYAGERIQVISQRVMTTENLGKIVDSYKLYQDKRDKTSLIELAGKMRDDIDFEMVSADVVDPRSGRPTTATIAFKLSFSSKDPRIAQKVTNELASLYLSENLKQREKSAIETSDFLASEASKLNSMVKGLEEELAVFKEENFNNLPELQELNIQLMERNERELSDVTQQVRAIEERIIYLESELVQVSPTSSAYSKDGQRVFGTEDRLMSLEAEYVSLSTRYTKDHPTLIKIKEEIDALKSESEAASKGKGMLTSKIHNPAYLQLQTQLNAAKGELGSLVKIRDNTQKKIRDYEDRLLHSPQVERKYRNLSRDYENALTKYQEVKDKQLEAELSESLERERKGERFSLIEPPLVPETPDKPNRLAILLAGLVLSIIVSIGNVAIRESLDDRIHGVKGIIRITKVSPLAEIPYVKTTRELSNTVVRKRLGITIAVSFVAISVVAVHFLLIPLDVLMYILLRIVGLG